MHLPLVFTVFVLSCLPQKNERRSLRSGNTVGGVDLTNNSVLPPMIETPKTESAIDRLKKHCEGGEYRIPNEPICSRAPGCKSDEEYKYDQLASRKPLDHMLCLDQDKRGCGGYVPFCCYVMAESGDFTACVGYWERLWCAQSQCEAAEAKGANNDQCAGDCQCAHANKSYCKDQAKVIPLEQRLPPNAP